MNLVPPRHSGQVCSHALALTTTSSRMTTCVKTRARGKRPVLPPCPKEVTTSRGYDSVFSLFFYYDRNVGKTQLPWLTMHAAPSHAPHTPHSLPSTAVVLWCARCAFRLGWATSGAYVRCVRGHGLFATCYVYTRNVAQSRLQQNVRRVGDEASRADILAGCRTRQDTMRPMIISTCQ